ncbi:MAG: pantetheine-phosphate adenylyltransferase [Gammaproteobacteria bacterium]
MKIALYPGTFDPVTKGHLDIITRGSKLFDKVVVAVARGTFKSPLFDLNERMELLRLVCKSESIENLEVIGYERELTVNIMRKYEAIVLLRGLRSPSDFEYELQLASMNRLMEPDYDSVFLPPKDTFSCISSTLVREIASLNGDLTPFVHPAVAQALKDKFRSQKGTKAS